MKTYKIKFGKGKDSVTMIESNTCLAFILKRLKELGWSIDDITKIKKL